MSMAIIANPVAGRGRGLKEAKIAEEILTGKNVDFELFYTQYPGHATELAKKASNKHEIVVALGGDGTIREVLAGSWDSDATLGIIPGGTGNDYARGLNIPRQTEIAIHTLLNGRKVPFDVCLKNHSTFGVLASIGFPVEVVQHVNDHRDGFWKGPPAFLAGVVATICRLKSFSVKITVDDRVIEEQIVGLLAMNMPYGGGGMQFTPGAKYDDGLMHLLIVKKVSKLDLAVTLPKVYSGKHISHPAISIVRGKKIVIESEPLPIMLDGDVFPPLTFKTKILPRATKMIVPKTPA